MVFFSACTPIGPWTSKSSPFTPSPPSNFPLSRNEISAFTLMYIFQLDSCYIGSLYHGHQASSIVERAKVSRVPSFLGHYPRSQLVRTHPPPSRLSVHFLVLPVIVPTHAPGDFFLGRVGLLQLLRMSLVPCYCYHPAEEKKTYQVLSSFPCCFHPSNKGSTFRLRVTRLSMHSLTLWPGTLLAPLGYFRQWASAYRSLYPPPFKLHNSTFYYGGTYSHWTFQPYLDTRWTQEYRLLIFYLSIIAYTCWA